ncbi:MAG: type II toxin-antitoxin system RelE/ParE family toxin [Gammaproteobacteria bacterium]
MAIKSFKQKWLEDFYYKDIGGKIKPQLREQVFRKLKLIDYACSVEDLKSPPGKKLHPLKGDRKGQWAVAVNGPWRLCFYFENQSATEIELIQYH